MKRKARTDKNQKEIVQALRDRGATILHLHQLGKGAPDILVGINGVNFLIEIKDGSKPPSKQKLTEDESDFHSQWKGQVCILNSVESAIALLSPNRSSET